MLTEIVLAVTQVTTTTVQYGADGRPAVEGFSRSLNPLGPLVGFADWFTGDVSRLWLFGVMGIALFIAVGALFFGASVNDTQVRKWQEKHANEAVRGKRLSGRITVLEAENGRLRASLEAADAERVKRADVVSQIQDLYVSGLSRYAIEREVFGYTGGAAFKQVKSALRDLPESG